MVRPFLGLERLSLDEREAKVCYQYGKETEEAEHMDYLKFIAWTTSHLPDKSQVPLKEELTCHSQFRLLGLCPAIKEAHSIKTPDSFYKPKPSS